jgi:hypothetical protein
LASEVQPLEIEFVVLEMPRNPFHRAGVSKVQQMGSGLRKLSQEEPRQIREWLDDFIKDQSEFAPTFEDSILRSERHLSLGKPGLVPEPQGS